MLSSIRAPTWRLVATLAVVLSAAGALAWLWWPKPPPPKPAPPVVEIAGQRLELGGDAVADAFDLVRRYARQAVVLELPDGQSHPIVPAKLGAEIDRVRLSSLVKDVLDPKSALIRRYRERLEDDPDARIVLPVPVRIDPQRALDALVSIKETVDRAATDAAIDLDKRELRPDEVGFRLDAYGTLARLDAALRRGASQVAVQGERVEPRIKASMLGNVKFDAVLGWFETSYSTAAKYKARTYNLRLAASKLDGTVLMPGETFDFNEVVGPRDEANGYQIAPVIAQGELVDGIGGGTCQISGTLHGAAFFAGMDIEERAPHTRPSSYIKLGLDAAVAYPTINFKLKNNFDFPVVLHQTVKNGVVRAEILGPERKRTVTFFRRIDEVVPFEVEEREDDDLPEGERVLSQRGVPGFKATVYRIVREGSYAIRTKRFNIYPPTTQIVRVGTGPSDVKGRATDDNSPEYRADEYLVMTQEPGRRDSDRAMIELREPGKTGQNGWQQDMGMPVFERADDSKEDEGGD